VSRRVDLVTLGVAIAVHAGLALGIARGRATSTPRTSTVELDFRSPPAAPPPPAATQSPAGPPSQAARAPAARRKVAVRERPAPAPAVPERAPTPAAAPAPKPMFAIAMASTTEVAAAADAPAVAATGAGRPGHGLPGGHGTAGPASGGEGGGGVAESDLARMPEVDADACGRAIAYPADAEAAGVEGDVRLRVSLTPEGRVSGVRVLSGLGHGLDQAATEALRTRCRFSPAIDKTGKPVAFVIRSYTFHFQLPGR